MTGPSGTLPTGGSTYDERLALLDAVRQVHAEVTRLVLPLDVPGAVQMRREREAVLALLDGYLVTRLRSGDRPLLAVIGGPTGAGKSTILNSLVGAPVSPASVLRPTTRTPVLLYHPSDEQALLSQQLLPHLSGATSPDDHAQLNGVAELNGVAGLGLPADEPARRLRLVARTEVPPGLAVLDSPDLDSWLSTNRELAVQLLGIADLWIFATTGTDYADAVPWALLDATTERRVTLATVLNRMRPGEIEAVRRHFAQMLTARGLASTPVFTIPELELVDERIPYAYVAQLNNWLARQSGVDGVREAYLERATRGTLDQVLTGLRRLVDAAADQVVAERRLRVDLTVVFARARDELHRQITTGALAPALGTAWRGVTEPAPSGGGLLRRLNSALRPADSPYAAVEGTVRAALLQLVRHQVALALHEVAGRWNDHPAAASVGARTLAVLPPDLDVRADGLVGAWTTAVAAGTGLPPGSPELVALTTLALDPDGAAAQTALRTLAARGTRPTSDDVAAARGDLLARTDLLLGQEERRLAEVLDRARISPDSTTALRGHLASLEGLRRTAFAD